MGSVCKAQKPVVRLDARYPYEHRDRGVSVFCVLPLPLIGSLNELLKGFSDSDSSASAFALRLQNYQLQLLPR